MRTILRLLPALPLLLASLGMTPVRALAEVRTERMVAHYAISGRDERALLLDMRRKGPRVQGKAALASTRLKGRYSAMLRLQGKVCRVQKLLIEAQFIVTLPRISHLRALQASARKRWPGFAARLKRHENRHIAIWRRCLREADSTMRLMIQTRYAKVLPPS